MNLDSLSWVGFIMVFVWPRHADLLFCHWNRKEVLLLVGHGLKKVSIAPNVSSLLSKVLALATTNLQSIITLLLTVYPSYYIHFF